MEFKNSDVTEQSNLNETKKFEIPDFAKKSEVSSVKGYGEADLKLPAPESIQNKANQEVGGTQDLGTMHCLVDGHFRSTPGGMITMVHPYFRSKRDD